MKGVVTIQTMKKSQANSGAMLWREFYKHVRKKAVCPLTSTAISLARLNKDAKVG